MQENRSPLSSNCARDLMKRRISNGRGASKKPAPTSSMAWSVLKTHCKALLIVRRDADRLRHYVHLGTGNYHSRTARIYTDFSLLTSEPQLTEEVATVFNTLTGLAGYPGLKKLMVAPFDMHSRLIKLIERERDNARAGKPARIVAKLNALVDQEIIEKLYEASCAGRDH